MSKIITVDHLYKNFSKREILKDINLKFSAGKLHIIKGRSGCGKSTLLSLLAFLDQPTKGRISFSENDKEVASNQNFAPSFSANNISCLFQTQNLFEHLSCLDNLLLVTSDAERIDEVLTKFKLLHLKNKKAANLSQGEKIRLALSLVILEDRPVWLLDEPTANLDANNAALVFKILLEEAAERIIIAVVHSDTELLVDRADIYNLEDCQLKIISEAGSGAVEKSSSFADGKRRRLSIKHFGKFQRIILRTNIFRSSVFTLSLIATAFLSFLLFDLVATPCNDKIAELLFFSGEPYVAVQADRSQTGLGRQNTFDFIIEGEEIAVPCIYFNSDRFLYGGQKYYTTGSEIFIPAELAESYELKAGDTISLDEGRVSVDISGVLPADDSLGCALISRRAVAEFASADSMRLPRNTLVKILSEKSNIFTSLYESKLGPSSDLTKSEVNIILPDSYKDSSALAKIQKEKYGFDNFNFLGRVLPSFEIKNYKFGEDPYRISLEISPEKYQRITENYFEFGQLSDGGSDIFIATSDYYSKLDYSRCAPVFPNSVAEEGNILLSDRQHFSLFCGLLAVPLALFASSAYFLSEGLQRSFTRRHFLLDLTGFKPLTSFVLINTFSIGLAAAGLAIAGGVYYASRVALSSFLRQAIGYVTPLPGNLIVMFGAALGFLALLTVFNFLRDWSLRRQGVFLSLKKR